MARLSDNEITQLKNEVSLQALVESSGIPLKKQGKDYLGHCPFHDDKTPSLAEIRGQVFILALTRKRGRLG